METALLKWIIWGKNYVILRFSIWTTLLIAEKQSNQTAIQINKDKHDYKKLALSNFQVFLICGTFKNIEFSVLLTNFMKKKCQCINFNKFHASNLYFLPLKRISFNLPIFALVAILNGHTYLSATFIYMYKTEWQSLNAY